MVIAKPGCSHEAVQNPIEPTKSYIDTVYANTRAKFEAVIA